MGKNSIGSDIKVIKNRTSKLLKMTGMIDRAVEPIKQPTFGNIYVKGDDSKMFIGAEPEDIVTLTVRAKVTGKGIREYDNDEPYVDLSIIKIQQEEEE